jgi:pimeloyl-ACP methyl ester carboxylesterase
VLYSAWAFEDQLPTFVIWSRATLVGEALFRLFYTERPEDWISRAYYDKRYITHDLVEAVSGAMRRPGARAAGLAVVRGQRYQALEERYGTVNQPTLIMWGREDRVALVEFGRRLARQIPGASLIVYPDTGHFPMIEAKRSSTEALVAFLGESSRASAPGSPEPPAAARTPSPAPASPAPAPPAEPKP